MAGQCGNVTFNPMSDTTAAISLRPTTATSKWAGATCPKCSTGISAGDQAVLCPKCYIPHHAQCWRDGGNACANDQTPARILEPRGRASAPAGEASSPAPAPSAPVAATAAKAVASTESSVPAPFVDEPLANPWLSARAIQGPPESELFRRNIMTIVSLLVFWAVAVFVATAFGVFH
ncbi:MAG: hypothetical protein NTX54_10790 [Chloroflexi bacterium]|nr:hypothetical protein [Chloroflexota bacterium]